MKKEILRAGTWTDFAGRTRKFTERDVEKIAKSFNEENGRNIQGRNVPLFIGHPSGASRAYGWVKKLIRDGDKLFAEFKEIPEKAIEGLKKAAYKDVSISLNSIDGHILQHVGLTNMPAVVGMEGFEFEGGSVGIEYSYIEEKGFFAKTLNIINQLFAVKSTTVQTLIFDKSRFKTEDSVRAWIKNHPPFKVM